MVRHFLLICVLTRLHAALLQGIVVVEEVGEQVPQHAGMIQLGLQEEIHREGAHTLDCHGGCFWETLRGRRGQYSTKIYGRYTLINVFTITDERLKFKSV